MNNEHNILDDFLRNKVDESQFAFKEDYWNKMTILLDEEEKTKKRPFLWRGLSIFFALVFLSLGAYLFPKLKTKKYSNLNKQTTSSNNLKSAQQDRPIAQNIDKNDEGDEQNMAHNNQQNQQESATQETLKTENQTLTQNVVPKKAESKATNFKGNSNSATNELNNELTQNQTKNASISDNNAIKENEGKGSSIAQESIINNSETYNALELKSKNLAEKLELNSKTKLNKSVGKKRDSKQASVTEEKNFSKMENANGMPKGASIEANNRANNTLDNINKSNPSQKIVDIHGKAMLAMDTQVIVKRAFIAPEVSNPRYMASLGQYEPTRFDSVTILTYKPLSELEVVISKPKVDKEIAKMTFEPKPFEMIMLAGMYANKGFKGNVSSPISWGLAPYVGVGFDKALGDRVTLSSHVGFTYFNGMNTEKSVSNRTYSFGVDSTNFVVNHKKMFQTQVPISLYYQVLRNHYLMASFGASYSMDVSSKVNNSGVISNGQMGYRTGFNQFDVYANVGYSYQIFNRIMVQIAFQQGFMDMTKNDYFKNAVSNTQSRFQIGIKYNFKRNDN